MTKEEKQYVLKIEGANRLLQERVEYLEKRLNYEDPVKAVTKPADHIPM